MGYIYQITNSINNKKYVGQTRFTIQKRWLEHQIASATGQTRLYKAMRKYGIENFQIIPIEECSNENLNERERYWIAYYDSYNSGYNMTYGGEGMTLINHAQILELWHDGLGITEIHNVTGHAPQHIVEHLKSEGITTQEIQIRKQQIVTQKRQKQVLQYSLTGQYINQYNSILEASQATHIDSARIVSVCKLKNYSAGNYIWLYQDNIDLLPKLIQLNNTKQIGGKVIVRKVGQYDTDNHLINIYNNLNEAAKSVGGNKSNISKVCNGKQKTSYGFIWRYFENETE